MKQEYGYWFRAEEMAEALHHLKQITGFLNKRVLSEKSDGPGLAVVVEYRTDKPYPLRVRISPGGYYVLAPCDPDNSPDMLETPESGQNGGESR